jgi:peptidoglycan hydrolase-like protein with peptidoglycan-binding domain
MRNQKLILTALVLSGSLGVGYSSSDRGSGSRSASADFPSSQSPSRIAATSSSEQKSAGKISQSDMRKVEEALKAKGYDPGPINGQMDAQTQQALRGFQSKNNLAVTGTVDQATADSLGVVIVIVPE